MGRLRRQMNDHVLLALLEPVEVRGEVGLHLVDIQPDHGLIFDHEVGRVTERACPRSVALATWPRMVGDDIPAALRSCVVATDRLRLCLQARRRRSVAAAPALLAAVILVTMLVAGFDGIGSTSEVIGLAAAAAVTAIFAWPVAFAWFGAEEIDAAGPRLLVHRRRLGPFAREQPIPLDAITSVRACARIYPSRWLLASTRWVELRVDAIENPVKIGEQLALDRVTTEALASWLAAQAPRVGTASPTPAQP